MEVPTRSKSHYVFGLASGSNTHNMLLFFFDDDYVAGNRAFMHKFVSQKFVKQGFRCYLLSSEYYADFALEPSLTNFSKRSLSLRFGYLVADAAAIATKIERNAPSRLPDFQRYSASAMRSFIANASYQI
jgi:hypothetical protein